MILLHCIPHLSGGGAQRQLAYLASGLSDRNHEVHIAYVSEGPDAGWFDERVVLHRLDARGNYDFALFQQLRDLVRRLSPDVVQTWLLQMDVLAGLAALLARVPWVLREPASEEFWRSQRGLLRAKARLRSAFGRHASAIVSNSASGDCFWRARRAARGCFMIPNGIPLADIGASHPVDAECETRIGDSDVILYAGRLDEPQKNIRRMIEALAKVIAQGRAVVVLCGEGPDRASAEQQVSRAGLQDRVIFTGHSTNVWGWMKTAAAFISMAPSEGQPNTVMEAMAAGCPMVLSDIPGHRALVDETMAFFADPHDVDSIVRAVNDALGNRAAARARAHNAAAKAQDFSIARMTAAYEAVYRDLIVDARRGNDVATGRLRRER